MKPRPRSTIGRRDILEAGALSVLGLSLGDLLREREALAGDRAQGFGRAKRCILLFMWGREITFADRGAIEAILDQCQLTDARQEANFGNYRLRSLIEELVVSELFLQK